VSVAPLWGADSLLHFVYPGFHSRFIPGLPSGTSLKVFHSEERPRCTTDSTLGGQVQPKKNFARVSCLLACLTLSWSRDRSSRKTRALLLPYSGYQNVKYRDCPSLDLVAERGNSLRSKMLRTGGVFLSLFYWLVPVAPIRAQQFDLLIKGGHVIDPKNQVDSVMDVAVLGGKIARVAVDIPAEQAKQTVVATGLYVTPGLVDIHTHVFYGTLLDSEYGGGYFSVPPDGFTFRSGVTTVVDAGSSGWKTFLEFKDQVIDRVHTRVLAFLNIVGSGMRGGPVEQNLGDMDPKLTAMRIREYPEILVGIKTAHYEGPEWDPVDRAVEAGKLANVPVMVDFGRFAPERPYQELVLKHLRPGDISTHMYLARVPMLDKENKVLPYLFEARQRGVIFDVGHGGGSFVFRQAVPAMKQGWTPDSISTDLHVSSMNAGMKDMLNVMSKFLNLGMSFQEVILRSTWNPAREIKRPELGNLSVGSVADLAVLNLRQGNFGFVDVDGARMNGTQKLECELTVREGQVVWDLNGISRPGWETMRVPEERRPGRPRRF
jgi:dihydroorotase